METGDEEDIGRTILIPGWGVIGDQRTKSQYLKLKPRRDRQQVLGADQATCPSQPRGSLGLALWGSCWVRGEEDG